jgi:hypothetical protein
MSRRDLAIFELSDNVGAIVNYSRKDIISSGYRKSRKCEIYGLLSKHTLRGQVMLLEMQSIL